MGQRLRRSLKLLRGIYLLPTFNLCQIYTNSAIPRIVTPIAISAIAFDESEEALDRDVVVNILPR